MAEGGKYGRQDRYNRTHTTMLAVRLNLRTDADVIERLSEVPSKQGYVKRLIREDIARGGAGGLREGLDDKDTGLG